MLEEILISIIASIVIGIIVYLVVRSEVKIVKSNLTTVCAENLPQINKRLEDIQKYSEVGRLKEEFQTFGQDILNRIDALKRLSTEELSKVRDDIMTLAERKSVDAAVNQVKQITITREEFETLRDTVAKMGGREEQTERLELLFKIFESTDIRVLTWQCKLIHLLEGGLAPDTEADQVISAGIPYGSAKDFLKKLQKQDIISLRKVESFWLNPDYMWLLTYTEEPDWLKKQLEATVKKEEEYRKHIRDNIELVEEGLIAVSEEFEIPSGKIDILARDRNGIDTCIELKYPLATGAAVGQMLKYREDLKQKTSSQNVRCILVAPKIPEKVKELLNQNQMEHKEIIF